jgi:hypothetical protein
LESVLSIIIRNHGYQDILEEIKWENVLNVEKKLVLLRRLGRCALADQARMARKQSLQLGSSNIVENLSELH